MRDFQTEHEKMLYERHRKRMRERTREASASGRDIAPIPEVVNPEAKEAGRVSFRFFCENYFPQLFTIPWSEDHLKVIDKIERAVKEGGMFAIAMPRGSGKALSLDTIIPTKNGYSTMGEIKVGDILYDKDGSECKVTFTTEVQKNRKCYKLVFSNGETVIADKDHLWYVHSSNKKTKTVNTEELIKNSNDYFIESVKPIRGASKMPSNFLLGAFYEPIVFDTINYTTDSLAALRNDLMALPDDILEDYFEVVKNAHNHNSFLTKVESLSPPHLYDKTSKEDFLQGFLLHGNKGKIDKKHREYLESLLYSMGINFEYDENSNTYKFEIKENSKKFSLLSSEITKSVPVKCIQVNSPSKTYCIGKNYLPTHNTTLCEVACVWAALYGYHNFILVIGCEADSASSMFNSIKSELTANELLAADFPEVCYPIESLEGAANRAAGQHVNGKRTFIHWNNDIAVLPTVEGSPASGCVIKYAGITGRIRGMKYKREVDGKNARPTLCIIDDPQTDESARSPKQVQDRLKVVVKTILNLPGAGQSISAICPCTVIEKNDMADKLLTRKEYPEWQGERLKALYHMPENMELWTRYSDIRNKDLEEDGDGAIATEFYKNNKEEMDKGASVAWPERFTKKEISGLQYLMNKYFEDKGAFQSEFQQEPIVEDTTGDQLTAGHIYDRLNGYERKFVPINANKVTAYIDVQKNALFYAVSAWNEDFTGYLIDYGTYPKQSRRYFTLNDLSPSLEDLYPSIGLEARLQRALENCCDDILNAKFMREDGIEMKIQKCYIDANWGNSTDVVYNFCKRSVFSALLTPSHGKYFGAKDKPLIYKKRVQGETIGHYWYYPSNSKSRAVRHIIIDTNYWKTFLYNRLMTSQGDSGCYTIFGYDKREHELLAEHLTSEYWTPTIGNERVLYEWSIKPGKKDNHWFDCIVGSAVAANELGCTRPEFFIDKRYKKSSISFRDAAETAHYEHPEQEKKSNRKLSFAEMAALKRNR